MISQSTNREKTITNYFQNEQMNTTTEDNY